jgi:TetR/AcrR family transcriptional regulator, transcriptional repressor for nem operon
MMFIEDFFRRCVAAGQKDGSIIETRPADEVAKLLLSVLLGIRVLARTCPQREVLEGAANGALALLETAANTGQGHAPSADIVPAVAAGSPPHAF